MPVRGQMRDIHPSECPPEIAALIILCLSEDPEQRPTARQMFETINVSGCSRLANSSAAQAPACGACSPLCVEKQCRTDRQMTHTSNDCTFWRGVCKPYRHICWLGSPGCPLYGLITLLHSAPCMLLKGQHLCALPGSRTGTAT